MFAPVAPLTFPGLRRFSFGAGPFATICCPYSILLRRLCPRLGVSYAMHGLTDVQQRTLSNGLQIILWPAHNNPHIALHNWVRVGSRNEGPGTSGLAHFFEHMMFNGTAKHPQGDFDRLMEAQGASNNADTRRDVTVHQDWLQHTPTGQ